MKILSNKKYGVLVEERNYYKNEYYRLLEENNYLHKHCKENEELLDKVIDALKSFKGQVVGQISNTKIKNYIDKILKLLGCSK